MRPAAAAAAGSPGSTPAITSRSATRSGTVRAIGPAGSRASYRPIMPARETRSEERRVGEEGRSRWAPDPLKKKKERAGVADRADDLAQGQLRDDPRHRTPAPFPGQVGPNVCEGRSDQPVDARPEPATAQTSSV